MEKRYISDSDLIAKTQATVDAEQWIKDKARHIGHPVSSVFFGLHQEYFEQHNFKSSQCGKAQALALLSTTGLVALHYKVEDGSRIAKEMLDEYLQSFHHSDALSFLRSALKNLSNPAAPLALRPLFTSMQSLRCLLFTYSFVVNQDLLSNLEIPLYILPLDLVSSENQFEAHIASIIGSGGSTSKGKLIVAHATLATTSMFTIDYLAHRIDVLLQGTKNLHVLFVVSVTTKEQVQLCLQPNWIGWFMELLEPTVPGENHSEALPSILRASLPELLVKQKLDISAIVKELTPTAATLLTPDIQIADFVYKEEDLKGITSQLRNLSLSNSFLTLVDAVRHQRATNADSYVMPCFLIIRF
jgi:hypothetical protein